jgi:hypothetical protein
VLIHTRDDESAAFTVWDRVTGSQERLSMPLTRTRHTGIPLLLGCGCAVRRGWLRSITSLPDNQTLPNGK